MSISGLSAADLSTALAAKLDASAYTPGLSLISKTDFSAVSSVSVNNVFTTEYENYRVLLSFSALSATTTISMRMRVSGADDTNATYNRQVLYGTSSTVGANLNSTQTSWTVGTMNTTYAAYNNFAFDFFSPQLSRYTTAKTTGNHVDNSGNTYDLQQSLYFTAATAFDGLSVLCSSGNMTGSISIYGYAKA